VTEQKKKKRVGSGQSAQDERRRAYRAKGTLQKFKKFFHAMTKLQTRHLKLAGQVAHMLTGRDEQIHATLLRHLSLQQHVPSAQPWRVLNSA
jgi:hypothetical protein